MLTLQNVSKRHRAPTHDVTRERGARVWCVTHPPGSRRHASSHSSRSMPATKHGTRRAPWLAPRLRLAMAARGLPRRGASTGGHHRPPVYARTTATRHPHAPMAPAQARAIVVAPTAPHATPRGARMRTRAPPPTQRHQRPLRAVMARPMSLIMATARRPHGSGSRRAWPSLPPDGSSGRPTPPARSRAEQRRRRGRR